MKKVWVFFIIWFVCCTAYAADCVIPVSLPSNVSLNELNKNTLYGYLSKYVSIQCPSDITQTNNIMTVKFLKSLTGPASYKNFDFGLKQSYSFAQIGQDFDLGTNPSTRNLVLTLDDYNGSMCLTMQSVYGKLQLLCQLNPPPSLEYQASNGAILTPLYRSHEECFKGRDRSRSFFSFSGKAVECVQSALDNTILYQDNPLYYNTFSGSLKSMAYFQGRMQQWVGGFLLLYVLIYGFKMALMPEERTIQEMAFMIIKMVLVAYFATGFNIVDFSSDRYLQVRPNGMQQYALPLLKSAMYSFSSMVLSATSAQNLCNFTNVPYDSGYSYYQLWDAIDCRLGKTLYFIGSTADLSNPVLPMGFFIPWLAFKFIFTGSFIPAICLLVTMILMCWMILNFIVTYIMMLVTIYGLSYISVLFIPTILFEQTRQYFDRWLKLIIGSALQPMVLCGFIVLVLNIYDNVLYEGCSFNVVLRPKQTFVTSFSGSSGSVDVGWSTIDVYDFQLNRANASDTCKGTAGYSMDGYYREPDSNWNKVEMILFRLIIPRMPSNVLGFLKLAFWSIMLFFIWKKSSDFAAELVGGVAVGVVTPDLKMPKLKRLKKDDKEGGEGQDKAGVTGGGQGQDKAGVTGGSGSQGSDKVGVGSGGGAERVGTKGAVSSGSGGSSSGVSSTKDSAPST